ncbi:MAG: type II toxin-antitoxin system RelE/ParE family toxin [Nitrospirae bacterium]|nr:type II toxin-antitoxin system RelE/ParE family toxin [Candidatus Troglogloeales bacterium]MBI3598291.1 type II toxin-antitoxin system RelE/ParE family toxin [Candidatus Troglogloeales bacterium]
MKYAFHPEAEDEFLQAIEYYEGCEASLGYDFAVEVYSVIERTMAYPKTWPIIEESIRRSLVRRFPYGILYAEADETLFIVAVMHLHRDPDYWKHRVQ